MAVALVFAMKIRDSSIQLDDDLEEFMVNIQPPITEENYSEILRRAERSNSEITDSLQSNDDEDEEDEDEKENESGDDDAVLATLSDETENEDDENDEENELDSTIRGKARQVNKHDECYFFSSYFSQYIEEKSLEKLLWRKSFTFSV